MRRFTASTSIAAAALLTAAGTISAQNQGRLVIVGGGLSSDNDAVYDAVLEGRAGDGPVCVIPTASADPGAAIESAVRNFDRHGGAGTATGIVLSIDAPAAAADADVVAAIGRCSGFYFSGGVQSRILTVLRPDGQPTPAFDALLARFRDGAVVAGSSAGAAIMSDPMIAGGTSAGAVAHGVTTPGADADGVIITPGLGFATGMLMDQHFLARGRFGRLLVALSSLNDVDLAFGIDENTALVIEDDRAWPVGASGVVVLDSRDADDAGASVRLDLISAGDRYDMQNRTVMPDPRKRPLDSSRSATTVTDDIFGRWQLLHMLQAFGASGDREITFAVDGGAIVLTRTPAAAALALPGVGVQDAAAGLTVTGLGLELRRHD